MNQRRSFRQAMLVISDDLVVRKMLVDLRKGVKIGKQLGKPLAIDPPLLSRRRKLGKLFVNGTIDSIRQGNTLTFRKLSNFLLCLRISDKNAHDCLVYTA